MNDKIEEAMALAENFSQTMADDIEGLLGEAWEEEWSERMNARGSSPETDPEEFAAQGKGWKREVLLRILRKIEGPPVPMAEPRDYPPILDEIAEAQERAEGIADRQVEWDRDR